MHCDQRQSQSGYALTEVLIAGVIAASVLVVTATGISTGLRATRQAQELDQTIVEANSISAQFYAGMPIEMIAKNHPDWTWRRSVQRQSSGAFREMAVLGSYEIALTRDVSDEAGQTDRQKDNQVFSFSLMRVEVEAAQ